MRNLFFIIALLFSISLVAQERKHTKVKYFYVTGLEYIPIAPRTMSDSEPVISNVFSTRCKENYLPIKKSLENEFNSYYEAYLSKRRGFRGLNSLIVHGYFDT